MTKKINFNDIYQIDGGNFEIRQGMIVGEDEFKKLEDGYEISDELYDAFFKKPILKLKIELDDRHKRINKSLKGHEYRDIIYRCVQYKLMEEGLLHKNNQFKEEM